jgi:hypothetical protein
MWHGFDRHQGDTHMKVSDWKDGEAIYCVDLVYAGGDSHVPASAIPSYLRVQLQSALIDGRHDAWLLLTDLIDRWGCQ